MKIIYLLYFILLSYIKTEFIPIKINSFEIYEITQQEGYIIFQFNNKYNEGDIIIQFDKENEFKNSTIYFYKNLSSIKLNDKREFENYLYSFYSYRKYELVINKNNPSFLGNNSHYIILNQFIKGKILLFNSLEEIPLNVINNNFFKFSNKYSNNNTFNFKIINFEKDKYLHYQLYNDYYNSTSQLQIYNADSKTLLNNSNETRKEQNYILLPKNAKLQIKYKLNIENNTMSYLILDFYDDKYFYFDKEQDLLELNLIESQSIFYMIDITNVKINDLLVIYLKWNNSLSIEFSAIGKIYDINDKEYIKNNIPLNLSEYNANITSNKGFKYQFISLKKLKEDEKLVLLKLINKNENNLPQKFITQRINSPITINETGLNKLVKGEDTYIYYIDRVHSHDHHKRPRFIYSSKENKIEIYSGKILKDNFFDFSFKGRFTIINPWTILNDVTIIVHNEYLNNENFDFQVQCFNETLFNFTLHNIDISNNKINNGHRFQIDDCNKKDYYAVFRYDKQFISYSKILYGDAQIFAIKNLDNILIQDFFPLNEKNSINVKYPKENNGSFEFYKIKCTIPSVIDLNFISIDISQNQIFESGKIIYYYLKEGKNVLLNSPFEIEPFQIELIENENKNQEIYLQINETKNFTINNKNLKYNYLNSSEDYFDLNVTSKKSNNLIIIRNGITNKNSLITSEMIIENSKENNIFIFPKNLSNVKEVQIFIDKNSDLTVNINYFMGIGKFPFYSNQDFLTYHIHNENEKRKYLIIPNPYNNINNLKEDEFFFTSIKVDLNVVFTYVFVKDNINISMNELSLIDNGLVKINLNFSRGSKKIVFQINKCENDFVNYKFIQNGKGIYEDISYKKNLYKEINFVEENLIMEITGIKESLFRYLYLENEFEYHFNPSKNYSIYCNYIIANNQLNITFKPYLKNEKVNYTIILSKGENFNKFDNDCSLHKILFNKDKSFKYYTFSFINEGKENMILKSISFPYDKNDYYSINIIAQQIENYKMIVSYNAIFFYFNNGGNTTLLLIILLFFFIGIIAFIMVCSFYYFKKLKKTGKAQILIESEDELKEISFGKDN